MTACVAIGSNLSALWILIANGWMQFPVGAKFNPDTMRMEVADCSSVLVNPVAQAKFVHAVAAGYVTGSVFVLAISALYLLQDRFRPLALRSMTVAASFGLAAALCVVVLGDESGYTASANQKMKIAAIEAMWETEPAPASFTLVGIPNLAGKRTDYAVTIPWVLGLITTRSVDTVVPGINDLVKLADQRIRNGLVAYEALAKLRADRGNAQLRALLDAHVADNGIGILANGVDPLLGVLWVLPSNTVFGVHLLGGGAECQQHLFRFATFRERVTAVSGELSNVQCLFASFG